MPAQAKTVSIRPRLYAREPFPGGPALPTEQVLAQKARMRTEQAIRAARASVAARRMRVERALLVQRVRTLRLDFSQRRRLHMALAKSKTPSELLERQATHRTLQETVHGKQQPVELVRRKRGRPPGSVSSRNRIPLSSVDNEQHWGVPHRRVLYLPLGRNDSVTSSGDGGIYHVIHHPYRFLSRPNWPTNEQVENAPSWKPTPSQQRGGTIITTPARRGGRERGRGSRGMVRIFNPATSSIPFPPSTEFHSQSPSISQTGCTLSPDHPTGNVSSAQSTPSTCPGLGDEHLERILIPDAVILQYDCSPLPSRGTTPGRRRMRRRGTSSSVRGQVSAPMGILPLQASESGSRGPGVPRRGRGRPRGSKAKTFPTDGSSEQTRAPVRLPMDVFDLSVEGDDVVVTEKVTPPEAPGTLYCVCKTPYDSGCDYLGCDLCQDWFHYACVGLDREATNSLGDSWHCPECRQAANIANKMLYCLCRTPYKPARVYIACDGCNEWYHAECVDLSPEQAANHTGTYICPVCSKTDSQNHYENNDAPDCISLDPSRPMDHLKMESPTRGSTKPMYDTALSEATRSELFSLIQSMKVRQSFHHRSYSSQQEQTPERGKLICSKEVWRKLIKILLFASYICLLIFAIHEYTKLKTGPKELNAETAEFIFVGGHESSGTGLMRIMLDAHPRIRCGAEPMVTQNILEMRQSMSKKSRLRAIEAGIYPKAFDEAIAAFIVKIIEHMGPSAEWLCHKQPMIFVHLEYLAQIFPQAKFIHLLRDGRAAIASSMERKLAGRDYRKNLRKWEKTVTKFLKACQKIGSRRCLTVSYEKLVLQPEEESRKIFDFLGIPWDSIVLHHETMLENATHLNKYEPSTKQFMRAIHKESLAKWASLESILPQDFIQTAAGTNSSLLAKLGYSACGIPPNYDHLPSNIPHIHE